MFNARHYADTRSTKNKPSRFTNWLVEMQKKSCHWNGSFAAAANQFIRYESKSNSDGSTIQIIDIYFHSFIDSHFHFIYLYILCIIAHRNYRAKRPNGAPPKRKRTGKKMDNTFYPCGQKLMIWKIAQIKRKWFFILSVCISHFVFNGKDARGLELCIYKLATGNDFGRKCMRSFPQQSVIFHYKWLRSNTDANDTIV